jgi:alkylhydroperoxidase family enzyme
MSLETKQKNRDTRKISNEGKVMPRLRQIPRTEADASVLPFYDALFGKDREPTTHPGTATGTPGNWWTVFAHVPDALRHMVSGFEFYRSRNRKISPKLRELGQARAGFARGSQFVFSQHCKALRGAGFSEEQIQAIPHWASTDLFDELERAVLAYTDDLVLQGGRVADGTFAVLQAHLNEVQIIELTYIVCTYEMHATMTRALRLEWDDVDERITEVAVPEGEKRDIDFFKNLDK